MTHEIPSRPPYTRDEAAAFRSEHRHVEEREHDGLAPVYALRHRHDDEEAPVEGWQQSTRHFSKQDPYWTGDLGDETPVEDMGERPEFGAVDLHLDKRPDVAALMADGMAAAIRRTEDAVTEGLAVAHEQDAALDELGSLGGSVTAFDKGESSGIEMGRLQAIKVIERHKAALKDDPDEYAVSILDDVVLDLMNGATS